MICIIKTQLRWTRLADQGSFVSSDTSPIHKDSDTFADEPKQWELVPAIDMDDLPPLEVPGQLINQHANVANYAVHSASSEHSRRIYESRFKLPRNNIIASLAAGTATRDGC